MIGQDVTASYVYVPPEGTVERSKENESLAGPYDVSQIQSGNSEFTQDNEWILLDATPASCANIGIHYLFPNKPPVDLVISGPNFGRNSTALYIMSSGTVGAAMEAALVVSSQLVFHMHTKPASTTILRLTRLPR